MARLNGEIVTAHTREDCAGGRNPGQTSHLVGVAGGVVVAVEPAGSTEELKNLRAMQLLFGHTKLEGTVRYLGIEVDDVLELAEQTEV